ETPGPRSSHLGGGSADGGRRTHRDVRRDRSGGADAPPPRRGYAGHARRGRGAVLLGDRRAARPAQPRRPPHRRVPADRPGGRGRPRAGGVRGPDRRPRGL
ncbi:MAG: hypothetical protein AVDCRST_MAG24-1507, partial [uncultured Nocardioidaceae bacterium]